MKPTPKWIGDKRAERSDRAADGLSGIPAWALLNRGRFGEADLCQWPDQECNAPRYMGTGFCASHVEEYRARSVAASERGLFSEPSEASEDTPAVSELDLERSGQLSFAPDVWDDQEAA